MTAINFIWLFTGFLIGMAIGGFIGIALDELGHQGKL